MANGYHLAQLNIARMQAPLEHPQMADFVANLDRINLLAETSPGFIWRLQTDEGDATAVDQPFGADFIVNLSLWQDIESLHNFVYRTAHTEIMRRRKEWFEGMDEASAVLWWVADGGLPDVAEAQQKLEILRDNGPSQAAFTFKTHFAAPT